MFGGLASLVQSPATGSPPRDVPPPTPVRLPRCNPHPVQESRQASLVRFLQTLHRPTEVTEAHFAALGVHVHADAPPGRVLPDPSFLPEASGWDDIDLDEARRRDETFRGQLCTGKTSPEARVYLDRRNELSIPNQAAFRTVRRIRPEMGKRLVQLGNSYEFFRQMELMATFWDDPSLPSQAERTADNRPTAPSAPPEYTVDAGIDQFGHTVTTAATESDIRTEPRADSDSTEPSTLTRVTYRTAPGSQMPAEFRHSLVSAFIKLVSYDFGCAVVPPRVEPRLQIVEPPLSKAKPTAPRASYFPSGCVFLCRAPATREAARAGIVEGPIAAVSARNTTSFSTATEQNIDFGRELIAALVTAQHRARAGRPEKRFGQGKWWATEKRWGGGEGGPIGREVEGDLVLGDKDAKTDTARDSRGGSASLAESKPSVQESVSPSAIPFRGPPIAKRPRKTLSIYDRYRMVRLPTSNWDRKTTYEAIGKVPGADFDDVFVVSSLFHHISILRVRVPDRLLQILDGGSEDEGESGKSGKPSWGQLEIWRSKWFDLFCIDERLEAMRLIWGMMAWTMRDNGISAVNSNA